MALSQEDLVAIANLVDSRIQASTPAAVPENKPVNDISARMQAEADKAEPQFYVHLADGSVVKTNDSVSTHVNGLLVIGRYPVEETTE